jgi:hypothetical protein
LEGIKQYTRVESVRVANGRLERGDKVAVAVTSGAEGEGLRIGRVLDIRGVRSFSGAFKRYLVQVLVTGTSSWGPPEAYVHTYSLPHRMVKL